MCVAGVVDVSAASGSVEMKRYPKSHPFAQLSGSDNIIAFTTQRYNQQPLIIRCDASGLLDAVFLWPVSRQFLPHPFRALIRGKVLKLLMHLQIALANIREAHSCRHHRLLHCRGPGAGKEVTAGGVFSDLLRLAAYLGAPS